MFLFFSLELFHLGFGENPRDQSLTASVAQLRYEDNVKVQFDLKGSFLLPLISKPIFERKKVFSFFVKVKLWPCGFATKFDYKFRNVKSQRELSLLC